MTIKNAREVAKSTKELIMKRRSGQIKSLQLPFKKMNDITMDGIEYGSLVTIAGLSGHGKSTLASMLQRSFVKSEPGLTTIYMSLEMMPERLYLRDLSSILKMSVRKLFGSAEPLNDYEMEGVDKVLGQLGARQNYYVYNKVTVKDIVTTVESIRRTIDSDDPLLVIIDHALLVAADGARDPKGTIDTLQEELNVIKKQGNTVIVQLSQANRDIQMADRVRNNSLHYPKESDLSTSSNMYQLSDYVMYIHIPEKLEITNYGPKNIPTKDNVFVHLLKNRDGNICVWKFKNDLSNNNLIDESEEKSGTESRTSNNSSDETTEAEVFE